MREPLCKRGSQLHASQACTHHHDLGWPALAVQICQASVDLRAGQVIIPVLLIGQSALFQESQRTSEPCWPWPWKAYRIRSD